MTRVPVGAPPLRPRPHGCLPGREGRGDRPTRCDGCITMHVAEAAKLGVSREEIAEALGVAVAMNAGAAVTYSARVLDAFAAQG